MEKGTSWVLFNNFQKGTLTHKALKLEHGRFCPECIPPPSLLGFSHQFMRIPSPNLTVRM